MFLHSDVESLPKTVAVVESSDSAKKEVKSTVEAYLIRELVIEEDSLLRAERYSSFKRLVRVTA